MPDPTAQAGPAVLIVSNGHGEDAVGAALANELPRVRMTAYPLVGTGAAYDNVPLLNPRRALPSGGFGLRGSWRALWADLRAGALAHWRAQRAALRAQRGRHDLVVAIGDVFCLQMAALAGTPVLFVATAKSEHNEPHRRLERAVIRRHASVIFTRDEITAAALQRTGLPARHVGNALMDTIRFSGASLSDGANPTVTILPGSRRDAYANLLPLLSLSRQIAAHVPAAFLCALAPGIDLERATAAAAADGWATAGDVLTRNGARVKMTRAFGDAVQGADVVVGLAGTANEQAAGLGKPVVTFAGPGAQVTRRFINLQQRLLGDAIVAARDWPEAAEAVVRLLRDPAERSRRGSVGRERMGGPGAVKQIAQEILRQLKVE